MFSNYLTSVLRNISHNKTFTVINLSGLAMGMTACMLIGQFVMHELSYDTFWSNSGQIYRVQQDRYDKGELSTQWAGGAIGIGPDLKASFKEVSSFVRMTKSNALLSYGDTFFREEGVYYASQDFFKVFGYSLVQGVDSLALKGLNKIVLSRSMAKKYFGDEDPIGKTISNNGRTDYMVTGLFEDLPVNTHMQVDALLSFATYAVLTGSTDEAELTTWNWDGFFTYLRLDEMASAASLEEKLPALVEKLHGEDLKEYNAGIVFHLQPISDIHLDSNFIGEFKANGSRDTTYFLSIVSILIILIAWINYVNLSTAKSIERAREVGIRKVMGGFRFQLIQQFLLESLLVNAVAVVIAIAMVILLMPWFSGLTGRELGYSLFAEKSFWLWTALWIVLGAMLSGMYPAFVLSSYKPVDVLKGRFKNTSQGVLFRKGMVVVQFMASVTLIVGTYTVYRQLSFMRNQDLGVDIDQTVVLRSPNITDSTYDSKYEVFKQSLMRYSEVSAVSASTAVPGSQPSWNAGGIRRLSQQETESNQYRVILMDHDFISSFGLEVVAGRAFSSDVTSESSHVMLNESGARLMGFAKPEDAINDEINFWGDTFRIVGVLKNYRQESSKIDFDPMVLRYGKAPQGYYSIKFNTSNVKASMTKFESDWKEFFPGNPFNYFFLDDHYNLQYKADKQFGDVFGIFSMLAIFIACLGLFGLSSLMALQRTKEIGVRKVMGASVTSILRLMSRDFLMLISVAILLAIPVSWWVMNSWLLDFANRISLTWIIFAMPSVLVVIIAMGTVSFHTALAATTNPVKSLRYE